MIGVTSLPFLSSTRAPIDSEYRYPSLKMCPTSTAVSMRSAFPQFGQASPAVTARRSAYAVG